ncbi:MULTISPECIES: hypothetical protein [Streptomyces]|uniref:hypothetical protein n=1 Tax=Streptomyces TaxID=1883 RepID=UPI00205AB1E5|nr:MULTISPECIES: hypothetical protein [Streptomyces]UPT45785.1 hypothetical protein MWG59_32990 [Streptomyces sp. WAC00303]WIY79909.1 hypothetical protein QPM16_32655 [Streptomyces anulatus]
MTWIDTRMKYLCVDPGQYGMNVPAESYTAGTARGIRLIRTSDITASGSLKAAEHGVHIDTKIEPRHQLQQGDTLLSRSGTLGRSLLVPAEADGQTFAGFLIRFRPRPDVDSQFLNFSTQSNSFQGIVHSEAVSSTIQNFNAERYANIPMRVPGIDEQRQIANFLTIEVGRMNKLETRYLQLSTLGHERAQAVIDAALLKFPGDTIPVSAACTAIADCVNKTAPVFNGETPYRMIRTSNIRNGTVDLTNTFSVEHPTFIEWNRRGAPRMGDILFTREAPLGQAGILRSNKPVFLGQRIMLYRANENVIKSDLLLYNFLASHMKEQLRLLGAGSLHEHMRVGDGLKLRVHCPPLEHQDALVEQIDVDRGQCLKLVNLANRQLALLAERRKALITAAVTGQFDVSSASGRNVTDGV